jgi:hypothetical protein
MLEFRLQGLCTRNYKITQLLQDHSRQGRQCPHPMIKVIAKGLGHCGLDDAPTATDRLPTSTDHFVSCVSP